MKAFGYEVYEDLSGTVILSGTYSVKEGLIPSLVILLGPAPSHHQGSLTLHSIKQNAIYCTS